MTPKVSCLNFGVQSLFDSKSSKVKKKNLPKFLGAKCGSTTSRWWEIWGSKTPKVSGTKLGMLFQNDDQMSKLKELTKISGGKVWSDRPKLTIIVCHLIKIVLP